jgi:hypothetical protein
MVEAKHAHHLSGMDVDLSGVEAELKRLDIQSPRLVIFDDGDTMLFEFRGGNGWLRDLDGDAHRFRRLGSVTCLEKKHQSKHLCEGCETRFDSEIALKMHQGGGWCRGSF